MNDRIYVLAFDKIISLKFEQNKKLFRSIDTNWYRN